MRKLPLLVLVILSIILGYSISGSFDPFDKFRVFDSLRSLRLEEVNQPADYSSYKTVILRVGLVADSHSENELLAKALRQVFDSEVFDRESQTESVAQTRGAQRKGINFVIGLGDYTNLGTIDELEAAKSKFDESKLEYFVTAGDRDGWQSRNRDANNFEQVFGQSTQVFDREGVRFVILDNSEIYRGIDSDSWKLLEDSLSGSKWQDDTNSQNFKFQISNFKLAQPRLRFVFAHKTPFHPESSHVMGENSEEVSRRARKLMELMEAGGPERSRRVDGFFSGDLHFFAKFNSPGGSVKMTTVGAVAAARNFQGPRFAILTVFDDYSWEVEDVEIR